MSLPEMILLAVALSIDTLAISLAVSAAGHTRSPRSVFRLSFHFALFQFLMPVLGWAIGRKLAPVISPIDHWVAFAVLVGVGARMLFAGGEAAAHRADPTRGLLLVTLSAATSVDALAVGLSLAMLHVSIWVPSVTIGLVTGLTSLMAIGAGTKISERFGRHAEVAGGVILLLLALRILASHVAA